jgi:hypothetical protein
VPRATSGLVHISPQCLSKLHLNNHQLIRETLENSRIGVHAPCGFVSACA